MCLIYCRIIPLLISLALQYMKWNRVEFHLRLRVMSLRPHTAAVAWESQWIKRWTDYGSERAARFMSGFPPSCLNASHGLFSNEMMRWLVKWRAKGGRANSNMFLTSSYWRNSFSFLSSSLHPHIWFDSIISLALPKGNERYHKRGLPIKSVRFRRKKKNTGRLFHLAPWTWAKREGEILSVVSQSLQR